MLTRGLEPPRVAPYGPEPYASASSATRAKAGSYNARVAACLQAEIEAIPGITQPASFLRARTSN